MSRQTIKLPARPASVQAAADTWPRPRKPVRDPDAFPPPAAEAGTARHPLSEPPRLSRRMTEMGLCSRREADEWIENGWVSVNGVMVSTLGARVPPDAKIEIKAAASRHRPETVTMLFNKPAETLCESAEAGRPGAAHLLRAANRWVEEASSPTFKATHLRRLALAAPLDADAGGMLVFTQESSVLRRLKGDQPRLEEEFQVRVKGELADGGLEKLRNGLSLDDIKLKPAQVSWQNETQLRFVLRESRPQQIRRMCELVGLAVLGVKRIRIGSVSLGKLPAGQWRYLRDNERF